MVELTLKRLQYLLQDANECLTIFRTGGIMVKKGLKWAINTLSRSCFD